MLTKEAYNERAWGPLPALRKVLENKKVPDEYYGPSSVSDNMFASIGRLMKITILVNEYENDIKEMAESIGLKEVHQDLKNLEEILQETSRFFTERANEVRKIYYTLQRHS